MAVDLSWLRPAPAQPRPEPTNEQRADFAESQAEKSDRWAAEWRQKATEPGAHVEDCEEQARRFAAEANRLRARAANLRDPVKMGTQF